MFAAGAVAGALAAGSCGRGRRALASGASRSIWSAGPDINGVERGAVHGRGEPVRGVLRGQEVVGAVAQEAARDGVRGVAAEAHDAALVHGGDDGARVGAVAVAGGLS